MVEIWLSRPEWILTADRLLVILVVLSVGSLFFDSQLAGSRTPGLQSCRQFSCWTRGNPQSRQLQSTSGTFRPNYIVAEKYLSSVVICNIIWWLLFVTYSIKLFWSVRKITFLVHDDIERTLYLYFQFFKLLYFNVCHKLFCNLATTYHFNLYQVWFHITINRVFYILCHVRYIKKFLSNNYFCRNGIRIIT